MIQRSGTVSTRTKLGVAKSKQPKYSYSCDQECTESSSLQLKNGTELATNTSGLGDAGKTDQVFTLSNADVKTIKKTGGKKSVPLRIVSTFADGDGNQQTITTKLRLGR